MNQGFTDIEIVTPQIGILKFYFQTNHKNINLSNKTFEIKEVGIRLSKITPRNIDLDKLVPNSITAYSLPSTGDRNNIILGVP